MSDDRSDDGKYISWARAVKVRDNFSCVLCGKGGSEVYLESHHLCSWDWDIANRYNLSNGVTLCSNSGCGAHQHFHKIFGYGGNHSFQFEQFKKIYKMFKTIISSPSQIDSSLNVSEK